MDLRSKTINKFCTLQMQHNNLIMLADFFKGKKFPEFLIEYRFDVDFFTSVVENYWPKILYTLYLEREFDEEEIKIIRNAHIELISNADCDFLFHYIEEFSKIFGEQYILTVELKSSLKSSPEHDAINVYNFMKKLTGQERQKYLYQKFPVSDKQVERICEEIRKDGFETVLTKYLDHYSKNYKAELEFQGYNLINDTFFSNTYNIFFYDLTECHFHIEGENMYVFLPEEMNYIREKQINPYTNQKINIKFSDNKIDNTKESISIIKTWETILRREINVV
jgi:hypothetical protein